MKRPFIIAIASEKGGVGKTTIATNLAVYLKALREDLPVTIASFDNHFSVDQMFALGSRPQTDMSGLFEATPVSGLINLGQYGVQYIASARRLQPPAHKPFWLQQRLHSEDLEGIVILDTRPILDWFSEAALLAADLVLVPIKDRAALVNAEALRHILKQKGACDRLWLVPSLVDTRARLNAEVRVHEFLSYSARERDYQVLDFWISKSPKVESLASGFASCIRPVLTHARNTAVHNQFRQLGEFVLTRFDARPDRPDAAGAVMAGKESFGMSQRQVVDCPVCGCFFNADQGHFFFDLRSRRRGYIHNDCLKRAIENLTLDETLCHDATLAITVDGPGMVSPESRFSAHLCDAQGDVVASDGLFGAGHALLLDALCTITGRSLVSAYHELILISCPAELTIPCQVEGIPNSFKQKRLNITRELRQAGLF